MKQLPLTSFADISVEKRKIKSDFFVQINKLIDWEEISKAINKHYNKGNSATGRPSYDGLLLFKMTLLQTWYGLSDYELEDSVNDRISFSKFVGLSIEDKSPDHSVISRFRTTLTKENTYEKLFQLINDQLEKHQIIVKSGVIVDASITDSPRKPRGKKEYVEVIKEDTEQVDRLNEVKWEEKKQKQVDEEAKWVIKDKKIRFGYKKHIVTDENGMVLGVLTTSANVNEISNLAEVLEKVELPKNAKIKADKGYKSERNDRIVSDMGLRNHIMHKAKKNKPLTKRELLFNRLVSKVRYKIERTFGSIKRWFQSGVARYVGKKKMHTQHIMEAIAYNLYRSPKIVMP